MVRKIDGTSRQLKAAIEGQAKVIITTIQKFSTEHLRVISGQGSRRFAVLIDEAHGSQSGKSAQALSDALSREEEAKTSDEIEELIAEYQRQRGPQPNISYFAFTATPRNVTLERFGTYGTDGLPHPFHLYSMRQAIEEGFILDVLQNYMTYKAYYRAGSRANRDGTVDGTALDPRYIDFAKAYCRYTHATSPVQFENQSKRLNALQFIEAAFRSLGLAPHVPDCNPTVLNTAVALAKDGVGAARHYQFALYIEQVHRFCYEHRFYNAPFQWRHGIRKPKDRTVELGDRAKEWREDRLPSPEAYSALAYVFRNAETFTDKLMSSVKRHVPDPLRQSQCRIRAPSISASFQTA